MLPQVEILVPFDDDYMYILQCIDLGINIKNRMNSIHRRKLLHKRTTHSLRLNMWYILDGVVVHRP